MTRLRSISFWACSASLLFHVGMFLLGVHALGAWSHVPADVARAATVANSGGAIGVELWEPPGLSAEPRGAAEPIQTPELARAERMPRPDLEQPGSGGEPTVAQAAVHLAASLDGLSALRETPNRLRDDQVQRLQVDPARRSSEDRRATPSPEERALVATGAGQLEVRPRPGARPGERVPPPDTSGLVRELPVADSEGPAPVVTPRRHASAAALLPRLNARRVRPALPRGPAAVPAEQRGRARDNRDSVLEAAPLSPALLLASTAGGALGVVGRGGQANRSALGWGEPERFGSRAEPRADGGKGTLLAAADTLSDSYYVVLKRKLWPHWEQAFPSWATAKGMSGIAIVGWTIQRDGLVSNVRLVRSSGIAEYDRNVLLAVRRAAPFPPVPVSLGARAFSLTMSFDALNPAVGRSDRSLPLDPSH